MSRFLPRLGRRSRLEWGARVALAVGLATSGYGIVTHALGQALAGEGRFEQAYGLSNDDATVAADLARSRLTAATKSLNRAKPDVNALPLDQIGALANSALDRDATAVPAATVLGFISALRSDTAGARQWFSYAERLSRRDLPTQLWLIEDAVGQNDIVGALRHYDIALRTKRAAADLLFPVLAAASADSAVAPELVKLLAGGPGWRPAFISYAAGHSPDPEATGRLFVALRGAGVAIPRPDATTLVDMMIARKRFDSAWRYFATIEPGVDRRRSRDPEFRRRERPSQFEWVLNPSESGVTASIQNDSGAGVLDFSAPPSVGGAIVQQFQLLPPGRYRLEGRTRNLVQPEQSRPYWALRCLADGRELGRVSLPNSDVNDGRFSGALVVPSGCAVQALVFVLVGSDAAEGVSGQIERVSLGPAQ